MILLNSVLVATDCGETSTSALEYGRNFARTFSATLPFTGTYTQG